MPGYQSTLVSQQSDGVAVTNTTTETTILPSQANWTLPAGYLWYPGQRLRLRASGRISTLVTSPGTLTLKVKLGPTSNIAVATSQAMALNVVAKTTVPWVLDLELLVRGVGGGTLGSIFCQGTWTSEAVIGAPAPSAGGAGVHLWQSTAPVVGTGFNSTVDQLFDLTATWSVANAANSIQCHMCALEDLTTTP